MVRRAQKSSLVINIDKDSKLPLPQQVYQVIERLILEQELTPGAEIPSSRSLSDALKVSRASVVAAYKMLQRDGYIESNKGGKTSVSNKLPVRQSKRASQAEWRDVSVSLSHYAQRILAKPSPYETLEPPPAAPPRYSFSYWETDVSQRPQRYLARYFAHETKRTDKELLNYARDPMGYEPLRENIARSLKRTHKISCEPDDVLIIAGLPQALNIISRVHVERGDYVAVEDPGYPPTRNVFELEGAAIVPIPVDSQGLNTDALLSHVDKRIRLAYITPTHQFPTGTLLDLGRRLELLAWARNTGAVLIEDEHDSAFNYTAESLPSLKALDLNDDVVFVGTFAKLLFPSFALAYMVVPKRLRTAYAAVREYSSDQVPLIMQAVLSEFMKDGGLWRHARRMKQVYWERRDALLDSLSQYFGDRFAVCGEQAGLHMLVRFSSKLNSKQILAVAQKVSVELFSTEKFYTHDAPEREFIIGYSNLERHEIIDAIKRLSTVI